MLPLGWPIRWRFLLPAQLACLAMTMLGNGARCTTGFQRCALTSRHYDRAAAALTQLVASASLGPPVLLDAPAGRAACLAVVALIQVVGCGAVLCLAGRRERSQRARFALQARRPDLCAQLNRGRHRRAADALCNLFAVIVVLWTALSTLLPRLAKGE